MSEASVETLFDEFAVAYRRGERPDIGVYLERAGGDRDALAGLIDRFLQAVPAREPSEEEVVLMQARLEQEAPLLVLRRRRKLGRQAVVDALVHALRLEPEKREKVAGYYHELETGILDPEPVDRSVWEALSDLLRANTRALAGLGPSPLAAAPAYRRFDADFVLEERVTPPVPLDELPDEVDRLFTGSA
jgi:hypothetical protein